MNATLVIGGTRSGKSRYAEGLFGENAAVRYLATGRRIEGDTEWDARIAAHAARRPASWTVEEIGGTDVAASLAAGGPVLVDDLATWLAGVLDDAGAWVRTGPLPEVDDAVAGLVRAVAAAPGQVVLVSAETGLGVVPESRAGRLFRDRLGELNVALADVCAETVLLVAGRPLTLPVAPSGARSSAGTPGSAAVAPPGASGPAGAGTDGAASAASPGAPAAPGTAAFSGAAASSEATTSSGTAGSAGAAAGLGVAAAGAAAGSTDGATTPGDAAGDVVGAGAAETAAPVPTGGPAAGTGDAILPTAVGAPDRRSRRDARTLLSELAVPEGALGRLGDLGVWLAACQAQCPPVPPSQPRVVLLAADHAIARNGVSAYPPEVSASRAEAAAAGRLPVAVTARAAGATVRIVDVGLVVGSDAAESGHVVARASGRIDREDALDEEQARRAWWTGRRLADEEIDTGADALVPATLAVGATTPAATLVAALTGAEPVAVVGRGSGIDDQAWMRKVVAIRDALRRARPYLRDPLGLLRVVGGADLTVLAGFLARAAERKVPAVLDGVAVAAAALLAEELAPGAKHWWLAAAPSDDPAAGLVLEHLSLTPLPGLGVRTGDGTAAVTALPVLVSAARLLAETGTARDTGIVPGDATAVAAR